MTRLAGAAGPIAFVVAWVVAGVRTSGYSPIDDAISRLAEIGAPARPLMTAGFVAFGVAVPAFAVAARGRLGLPAATSLAVAGLATLGVAAFPLEAEVDDTAHGVFAGLGYAGMAAAPLLVRRRRPADRATGALAAASLLATALGPWHGLFQRLGLTVVDAWIVREALRTGRGQARQRTVAPVPASSTEPGMTLRRWGSRRSREDDGDSPRSWPRTDLLGAVRYLCGTSLLQEGFGVGRRQPPGAHDPDADRRAHVAALTRCRPWAASCPPASGAAGPSGGWS